MIVASSTRVSRAAIFGLGDTGLSDEAVAMAQRADKLFRDAGSLSAFPFLGREGRVAARQIEQDALTAHQEVQTSTRPLVDISARLFTLEQRHARLVSQARTNTVLASLGMAAVLGVGGYYIWKKS